MPRDFKEQLEQMDLKWTSEDHFFQIIQIQGVFFLGGGEGADDAPVLMPQMAIYNHTLCVLMCTDLDVNFLKICTN